MKKTYLCGYYGMKNSGDDALLMATLEGAKSHFNKSEFSINSPSNVYIADGGTFRSTLQETPRYRGENRLLQCYNALKSDQIIFGGGSVLHCKRDMDNKYLMMKLAGKGPHFALGLGIEPFDSVAAEKSCKRFLENCAYVGVRDAYSYNIATNIAPGANIEQTFDLAPSLLPKLEQFTKASRNKSSTSRRGIGVALCPIESIKPKCTEKMRKQENVRTTEIALCLDRLYRETGEPIFIFDLNGHKNLGDASVHDELQKSLPDDVPVFRMGYQSNPLQLIHALSRLRATLSMRLHGSVFSYLAETPFISLNYHKKCAGWCDQVDLSNTYRFDTNNIDIDKLIHAALLAMYRKKPNARLPLLSAFKQSSKNFTSPLLAL